MAVRQGIGQLDQGDAVVVADFGGRQRERRAGIADAAVVEALGFVQVAEGDIGDFGGVDVGRDGIFAADADGTLGTFGYRWLRCR